MREITSGPVHRLWILEQAHEEWLNLNERDQAKLEARAELLVNATSPLDQTKFRAVEGVSKTYELKTRKPPLRAILHRADGGWVVSLVTRKPKPRRLVAEAEKGLARFQDHCLAREEK